VAPDVGIHDIYCDVELDRRNESSRSASLSAALRRRLAVHSPRNTNGGILEQ
jgi:hypothetical protein